VTFEEAILGDGGVGIRWVGVWIVERRGRREFFHGRFLDLIALLEGQFPLGRPEAEAYLRFVGLEVCLAEPERVSVQILVVRQADISLLIMSLL